MANRTLLLAILAAGLAGVVALSAVSQGHQIEVDLPFGVVGSLLVFGLAVLGNRFAWGVAFVISVFGAGVCGVWALTTSSPDRPLGWAAAAVWAVVALTLWGLMPPDRAETPD